MAGSRTVKIEILGEARSAQGAFAETGKAADGLISKLGGLGKGVAGIAGGVAKGFAYFGLAAQGVTMLGGAIEGFVSAAFEGEEVAAQTAAAIESTGGAAGMTADEIAKLADAHEKNTRFSAESVQAGENLLLTFTKIGKDTFPLATQTMLDMAQALGTDASGGAIQLGKALNDPINGITSLTRVGVTFTDAQKDQIKTMVEAGDVAGAQAVILQELQKEFGGSAEAAGKTLPGQLDILKNRFGNLQETLAGAVIPLLLSLAQHAFPLVESVVNGTAFAIENIADGFNHLKDESPANVFEAIGERVRDLVNTLRGPLATGMRLARDSVVTFIEAFQGDWTDDEKILGLHRAIGQVATVLGDVTRGIGDVVSAVRSGDWSGAGQIILDGLGSAFSGIAGIASSIDWSGVAGSILGALGSALSSAGSVATTLVSAISTALSGVDWSETAGTVGDGILAGLSAITDWGSRFVSWLSSTVTGVDWSAVAGTVGNGLLTGLGAVTDWGSRFVTWIAGTVSAVDWSAVGTSLANGAMLGLYTVTDWGSRFITWFSSTLSSVDWSALGTSITDGLGTAIATIAAQSQNLYDAGVAIGLKLQEGVNSVDWSSSVASWGAGIANTLVVFGALTVAVNLATAAWGTLAAALAGGAGFAGLVALINPVTLIIGAVAIAVGLLTVAWLQNWGDIQGKTLVAWKVIEPVLASITHEVEAIVRTVLPPLGLVWGATWSTMQTAASVAWNVIGGVFQSIQGSVQVMVSVVVGVLSIVVNLLQGDFSGAWQAARTMVTGVVQGMGQAVSGLPAVIVGYFTQLAQGVLGILGPLVGDVTAKGGEIISGLVSGIVSGLGSLAGMLGTLYSMVTGFFSGALTWLEQAGMDIITGLWNGMSSMKDWIIGQATGLAGSIKDGVVGAFDSIFQRHSPSRVMMAIGNDIMAGLTIGFEDGAPDAVKAAADAAKSVIDAFDALLDLGDRLLQKVTLPSQDALSALSGAAGMVITTVQDLASRFSTDGMKAAKEFADSAKPIIDLLKATLEAFDSAEWIVPPDTLIALLKFAIEKLVTSIADTAAVVSTDALAAAQRFAESAKPVLDLLKSTIEAFDAGEWVLPTNDMLSAVKFAVEHFVQSIVDTAAMFSEDALAAAQRFAAAAGPVMDLLRSTIEAFDAGEWVIPTDDMLSQLKFRVEHWVRSIADSAAMFSQNALDNAKAFADAASAAVGWIGSALDAFRGLAEMDPNLIVEEAFERLVMFANFVVLSLQDQTAWFTQQVQDAATVYNDTVSAAVGWISSSVDAFAALAGMDPEQIVDEAFEVLVRFANVVVLSLKDQAKFFTDTVQKSAETYGSTVEKAIGWITGAVDAFAALGKLDLKQTIEESLDTLVDFASIAVEKVDAAAASLEGVGWERAQAFAQAAGAILDLLSKASDWTGMKSYGKGMLTGIDAFFADVKTAVQKLIALGDELGNGLIEAQAIAQQVNDIVSLLTPAAPATAPAGASAGGGGGGGGRASGGGGAGRTGPAKGGGYYLDGVLYSSWAAAMQSADIYTGAPRGNGAPNTTGAPTVIVNNSIQIDGQDLSHKVQTMWEQDLGVGMVS